MILENNKKFVKKKTKKNAYTAITMSLINGKWEPQTVSSSNKLPQQAVSLDFFSEILDAVLESNR